MLHNATIRQKQMRMSEFITSLISKGYCTFTFTQAKEALEASDVAVRAALRRLKQKGELAQPLRGFYVIVSPEYRILGCRPADQFINELMQYINAPYYVGLLSAAQFFGAAHHKPQVFQVITNKKHRAITCGRIKIVFITKKSIDNVPTQKLNTTYNTITLSTPEATAMDLVIYARQAAGLDNVITVLSELADKIDPKKLAQLVDKTNEISWVQRLGYMLDSIKKTNLTDSLVKKVSSRRTHTRILMPIPPRTKKIKLFLGENLAEKYKLPSKFKKNKKWKLIINRKLEPDV